MDRPPHENVLTALVDPEHLRELELALMPRDLWVWPLATAPFWTDGERRAMNLRRRMVEARQGAWDCAAEWTPVWISFGPSWRPVAADPLPWAAHQALYDTLARHEDVVRYRLGLGGVPRLPVPQGVPSR